MAIGSDLICASLVLEFKKKYKNVILECAIPCLNQTEKWTETDKLTYKKIIEKADIISYVSKEQYFDGCLKKRNEYMVNKSSLVIAIYNGKVSGTKQTISLANKKGIDVIIIKP